MDQPDSMSVRFVADGCRRAREGNEPKIRAAVEKEFAAELQAASIEHRQLIRRRIEREIERRLERVAPSDGLY